MRVTRTRLLVVESVYRSRLERFWLDLLDRQLNRHRHDGRMNVPLAFRCPEQWQALFESHGLRVIIKEWLGSRVERLVHHPLLFVIDKGPGERAATAEKRQRRPVSRVPDESQKSPC